MYPMNVLVRMAYWKIFVHAASASSWGEICIEEYNRGKVRWERSATAQTN
jgi:hypothetical protein